jgi:hypothetical protein
VLRLCAYGVLGSVFVFGFSLVGQQPVQRVVCDRLLPAAALAADVGAGFVLNNFNEPQPNHWWCLWETGSEPPRTLSVDYWATGPDRVRDLFVEQLKKLSRFGLSAENVYDLGSVAVIAPENNALTIEARTDDAIITVLAIGIARAQTIAVAKRVAATSPKTIADARAALAKARGEPLKPFEPLPPLPDIVVRRNGQPLECERLLPRAELVVVLGEAYRLVEANDPRPGFSFCEWKRPTDDYTFALRVHAEPEFAGANVKGPEGFFALEVSLSPCQQTPGQPLKGIGQQAVLCSSGRQFLDVIVRRAKDVLALSCFTCTREQIIALARAAVQ